MESILFGLGVFLILATLIPLIPKDNWWIRGFDFPRLQIISLILLVVFGYLLFRTDLHPLDYVLLILLITSVIYQGYMISPYTVFAESQVEQTNRHQKQSTLSLMCSNVQMTNRDSEKLKTLITKHDPDVLLVIETNQWWLNELQEFEDLYPHSIKQPQDNKYGMGLFSKFKFQNAEINFFVEDDIPSIKAHLMLSSGTELKLYGLHPRPPFLV